MKSKVFVKGAVVLILCNLIGKVIGLLYRLPLVKIIGSVGMGQYQLTFPLYCLILTISTSGIPVAISKLVAEYNTQNHSFDSKRLLKVSIVILTSISFLGATLVVLFAKQISLAQGNPDAYLCYYGIAPAILFVGVLSAFRGYFQGNLKMFPTAISGLVEQVFKLVFGLYFARLLIPYGTEYAVFGALVGVSISELAACVFLVVCYVVHSKKHKVAKTQDCLRYGHLSKRLLGLSVPATFSSVISPITSMVDSFLVVNLLMLVGFSSGKATMLLGLQSGVVEPLVNIPVIISVSIAASILPNVSRLVAKHNSKSSAELKELIEKAYQICLSISVACFICFIIFGRQALEFLYGSSFDKSELLVGTRLLFFGAVNIVFLSLVQVTTGVMQGIGEHKYAVKTLMIGSGIKLLAETLLLVIKSINIYGVVISGGLCYVVVLLLNYKRIKKVTGANLRQGVFLVSIQSAMVCVFAYASNWLFMSVFNETISMFIAGVVTIVVFLASYYYLFIYREKSGDKEIWKGKLT